MREPAITALQNLPLVILGSGYTGTFLYHEALQRGYEVFATSRSPDSHLSFVPPPYRIRFDLEDQRTWKNLSIPSNIVWCFPALPPLDASEFAKDRTSHGCHLLLLGSTSAFSPKADALTDERDELNMTLPRVQSEEHLCKNYGAIVLRLAGIYGPGRHVLDWIRRGKIKNTNRHVNLIHVEDVAALCLAALHEIKPGSSYIVSDGTPRLWSDICRYAKTKWNISIPEPSTPKNLGKRLSPQKLLTELNYELRHPDLFEELDKIEATRKIIDES